MSTEKIYSYKQLIVWQKAKDLAVRIYELTNQFPKSETYGLASQMQRSAVSIASNIAEGQRRSSQKEYRQFLYVAYGSGAELETQLEIVRALPFSKGISFDEIDDVLLEVMKMLNKLISKFEDS